jgi:hypothetical protein
MVAGQIIIIITTINTKLNNKCNNPQNKSYKVNKN